MASSYIDAPQGRRRRRETNYSNTRRMVDIEEKEMYYTEDYMREKIQCIKERNNIEREKVEELKRIGNILANLSHVTFNSHSENPHT